MTEQHLEPCVTIVSGTADEHDVIPPGTAQPMAISTSVDRALVEMNTKIGTMADLLGRFCESMDDRDRQATGHTNSPPGNVRGKAKASTRRRQREESAMSSSSGESDNEAMSVCASEDDLERLISGTGTVGDKMSDDVSGANASDSLLAELEASINDDENLGPNVNQKLADIALKRWGKKLSQEKLKTLLGQHEVPENCAKLRVPKVNGEIWSQLTTYRKTADLRLSNMQKTLLRVMAATLTMCDKVLALNLKKEEQKAIMADGVDSIGFLSHIFTDLSGLRKEQMKPALKSDFHSLCSKELDEPNDLLFGDDLAKQIRDAKEATKIGVALGNYKHDRHRGHKRPVGDNYPRSSSTSYNKRFLSKGGKSQGFRKKPRHSRKTDDSK